MSTEYIDTTRFAESLCQGDVRVDWVELGEGICGEYNEDDPEDMELLRFDVYEWVPDYEGGGYPNWRPVDDASYCTLFPVEAKNELKQKALEWIMNAVTNSVAHGKSVKKTCEHLSWIEPAWVEG